MRRVILAIVTTTAALVMILSFKTHGSGSPATPPAAVSSPATTSDTDGATSSGSGGATGGGSSTTAAGGAATSGTKTATGDAADTRYGPVQVKVAVTNGRIVSVSAIEYPENSPRDAQINAYAIPALNQEAVQAGSANINMISGATFTSDGYITSLQSALDKAKA